jgi:hypothetical protein
MRDRLADLRRVIRSLRHARAWTAAAAIALTLGAGVGASSLQMPNVQRSITELNTAPDWLYTPSSVRLAFPAGVRLELVAVSIVSSDQRREAALIGMFRNRSRALSGTALTLSYLGPDGETVVRSVPNAAYVSEVPVDGLLPFRFPLLARAAVPEGFTGFDVSLDSRVGTSRRNLPATLRGDVSTRGQRDNGTLVVGDIEVTADSSSPPPNGRGILVTLLLLDKNEKLLEVLPGTTSSLVGLNTYRVELGSFLPLARQIKSAQVYVEAAPDIQ